MRTLGGDPGSPLGEMSGVPCALWFSFVKLSFVSCALWFPFVKLSFFVLAVAQVCFGRLPAFDEGSVDLSGSYFLYRYPSGSHRLDPGQGGIIHNTNNIPTQMKYV